MTQSNTAPNAIAEQAAEATKAILSQHEQLQNGCSIIGYDIRNWSGKKTFSEGKVTALDNSGTNVELPTDLVSPGRKSLLDTKTHLSFCNKFSSRMSRLFNKFGIKFLGNYLIADALLPELLREAKLDIAAYEVEVEAFCSKYEKLIAEWCVMHPGLESVIRDGYMSVGEVRSRFKLRIYTPVRFSPRVEEDLADIVGEASFQLFEDIAKEAQSLLKESLTIKTGAAKGSFKEECTQDIKRPLRRLRDKVFSLYMLNPVFEGVVDVFDDLLDKALPDSGKIKGSHFSILMAHVMMMTDSHKLTLHATGVNQIAAKIASEEVVETVEPTVEVNVSETEIETSATDECVDDEEAELLKQLSMIRRKKQEAQAKLEAEAQAKLEAEAQAKLEAEAQAKLEAEALFVNNKETVIAEYPTEILNDQVLGQELAETEISIDVEALIIAESITPKVTAPSPTVTTKGFFF